MIGSKRNREEEITRIYLPELIKLKEDSDLSISICMTDIFVCHQLALNQPANETWRRLVIRTIFTSLELWCNSINQTSDFFHKRFHKILPKEDRLFLQGKRITKGGEQKDLRVKFGEYFTQTLRIYAVVMGQNFQLTKDKEWPQFLKAIGIRNRITHPRRASDLHIDLDEYKEATNGCLWAARYLLELFRPNRLIVR